MPIRERGWVKVGQASEIAPGRPKAVDLEGARVALFKVPGEESGPTQGIYCIEDLCTHDDGPVAEGPQEGDVVECPRHGARFNIKTGEALCMPAVTGVRTFPVRIVGGEIQIEVKE